MTKSSDAYTEYELHEQLEDMRITNARLRKALRKLIKASDGLTSAIESATDQFDTEKGRLMDATSTAEKVLKGGAE